MQNTNYEFKFSKTIQDWVDTNLGIGADFPRYIWDNLINLTNDSDTTKGKELTIVMMEWLKLARRETRRTYPDIFSDMLIGNKSKAQLQKEGQFLTPLVLTDYMCKSASEERLKNPVSEDGLRVCDPCCGTARFCLSYFEYWANQPKDKQHKQVFFNQDTDFKSFVYSIMNIWLNQIPHAVFVTQGNSLLMGFVGQEELGCKRSVVIKPIQQMTADGRIVVITVWEDCTKDMIDFQVRLGKKMVEENRLQKLAKEKDEAKETTKPAKVCKTKEEVMVEIADDMGLF